MEEELNYQLVIPPAIERFFMHDIWRDHTHIYLDQIPGGREKIDYWLRRELCHLEIPESRNSVLEWAGTLPLHCQYATAVLWGNRVVQASEVIKPYDDLVYRIYHESIDPHIAEIVALAGGFPKFNIEELMMYQGNPIKEPTLWNWKLRLGVAGKQVHDREESRNHRARITSGKNIWARGPSPKRSTMDDRQIREFMKEVMLKKQTEKSISWGTFP
jgi:hypothetical protein